MTGSQNNYEDLASLLHAVTGNKPGADAALLEIVYEELRAIAGALFKNERANHTLEPTALVHEAYVKLLRTPEISFESRAHFIAIAAKAMRHVLIDHARAKRALKRAAGANVTLSGVMFEDSKVPLSTVDVIDINTHLETLAQVDPRQASIVEMRFFAGMSTGEIALVLGVSNRTIELEWRMARAWLRQALDKESA